MSRAQHGCKLCPSRANLMQAGLVKSVFTSGVRVRNLAEGLGSTLQGDSAADTLRKHKLRDSWRLLALPPVVRMLRASGARLDLLDGQHFARVQLCECECGTQENTRFLSRTVQGTLDSNTNKLFREHSSRLHF